MGHREATNFKDTDLMLVSTLGFDLTNEKYILIKIIESQAGWTSRNKTNEMESSLLTIIFHEITQHFLDRLKAIKSATSFAHFHSALTSFHCAQYQRRFLFSAFFPQTKDSSLLSASVHSLLLTRHKINCKHCQREENDAETKHIFIWTLFSATFFSLHFHLFWNEVSIATKTMRNKTDLHQLPSHKSPLHGASVTSIKAN